MQAYFEATPEQKAIAQLGRDMMDWSEEYGKIHGLKGVTDNGLRTLNDMSSIGYRLTTVGASYGTSLKDFNQEEQKLISKFMNDLVDIERK